MRHAIRMVVAAMPIMMASHVCLARIPGCGGSDAPVTSATDIKLDNKPNSTPFTRTEGQITLAAGAEVKVGGLAVVAVNGEATIVFTHTSVGGHQTTPFLSGNESVTFTEATHAATNGNGPVAEALWMSGSLFVGKMTARDIASIDAGGEPLRIFFALPYGTQSTFEAANLAGLGVHVYDTKGVELDVYARRSLVASKKWPEWAPYQNGAPQGVLCLEWRNADGSVVSPRQLGLDVADRVFRLHLRSYEPSPKYDFCYGLGLWRFRDRSNKFSGSGVWTGWHCDNWTNAGQSGVYPMITGIQDANGNYTSTVTAGQTIRVVVKNGYDLPYVSVQVAGVLVPTIASAMPGPGPSDRTYVFQVPAGVARGSQMLYFHNNSATPLSNPAKIGQQIPGVFSAGIVVQ